LRYKHFLNGHLFPQGGKDMKQINGVTESMLKNADKLAPISRQELAKKIGIEITESGITVPDKLFRIFSPRVLGKFIGGIFLVVVGDVVYQAIAKRVIAKYPNSKTGVNRVVFVLRHIDVLVRPSWLKFAFFTASNVKEFKKGFDSGCDKLSDFGECLKGGLIKIVGDDVDDDEVITGRRIVHDCDQGHNIVAFCSNCLLDVDDYCDHCPKCGCLFIEEDDTDFDISESDF
jgi:hypothetical protein